MRRHELWRTSYRADRYMRHLAQEELERRLHDIVVNIVELTTDNKIGLMSLAEGGEFWFVRLTEVLEEYKLRFGQYPAGFREGLMAGVPVPLPGHRLAEEAATVVRNLPLESGAYLAKYNPREYMLRALEKGEIFIRAASSFDDPSLNPARRSNELEVTVQAPGDNAQIEVFDATTGASKGWLKPLGNISYASQSNTDFFVYSLSTAWSTPAFRGLSKRTHAC